MPLLGARTDHILPKLTNSKNEQLDLSGSCWPGGLALLQHIWLLPVWLLEESPPRKLLEGSC